MADLQTNLQRLENNSDEILSLVDDISDAIIAKGGTVPANTGLRGFANAINSIPSGGGGGSSSNDVNFYDYDGTIVNSYTAAEFAELTELPTNPSHEGLTSQGWNWSLVDAKTYVSKYGKLNIGQMYITDDGKTRVHINLIDNYTSPTLELYLEANSEVDIDWGDGSTHSTFTSTAAGYVSELHSYSIKGDYTIIINVINGGIRPNGNGVPLLKGSDAATNRAYREGLYSIEIGNSVTSIGTHAFETCYSLSSITIPDSVTSIDNNVFASCSSLSSITIPDSVTSINNYAFQYCYSLFSITIPDGVTSVDSYAFAGCYSLSSITIPDSVTSIGNSTFSSCYLLSSITIPDSVTTIGSSAFNYCYSLTSITIPDSVTSIGGSAFYYCYSLSSITIPDSVTSIGSQAFSNCSSLSSITIIDGVTSIGTSAFASCSSLSSITIPDSVTSIGNTAFNNCYSLLNIYVANTSIPTGSPWGAPNSHVNVVAIRHNNYQSSCTEVASGTTLTGTVNATVGDLVVATFVIRGNTYTTDSGWTLLGISEVVGAYNQRTAMAYKIATSSSESLTVTQDTAGRIYINLVSITGASVGTFSGFTTQATGTSITLTKPQGLVIWGVSSSLWGTQAPYTSWKISDTNNITAIQLPTSTQPRCLTALDQSNNATETFRYSPDTSGDGALAAASLTITGIDNFWYYDN